MRHSRVWIALISLTAVLTTGCDSGESDAKVKPGVSAIPVETMVVGTRPFVDTVDVSGVVRPMRDVRVSAEAPGRVLAAPFEEGEKIERGKLLLRVDSQVDSARIDVLKSQVSTAKREFDRTRMLAKQGLATPQQLDQAASQVDQASLNLKQARVAVGKSTIRSPIEGHVATKDVEKGEYVAPGKLLAHIVDYDTVKVEASVPEGDVRYITEGKKVDIFLPALERTVHGTVEKRAIVASERTRTYPVEIHVPNPGLEILPGMRARVIVPRKDYGEVVVVPREAVLEGFENEEIMVLESEGDEGKAIVKRVELGPSAGGEVVVLSGVERGDRMIVKGHRGIADGTRVRVVSEATPKDTPSRADASDAAAPAGEEVVGN